MQNEIIIETAEIEANALKMKSQGDKNNLLTGHTIKWGKRVVRQAWKLGDYLWSVYDEKF